jgi:hypothetical protein
MIDDPRTVASLIQRMQDHLPIPAFPTKEIVRTLRRAGVKASVDRPLSVKHRSLSAIGQLFASCHLRPRLPEV